MLSIIVLALTSLCCNAQYDYLEAAMKICGAESIETMDSYEVERFEDLARNPLRINYVNVSAMEASGLMTHYQAVSLADYRSRHGDILSVSELASVDGFGKEAAFLLTPFISFEKHDSPFERRDDTLSLRNVLSVRSGMKAGKKTSYGIKYRMNMEDRLSCALAVSKSYDSSVIHPDSYTGNFVWYSGNGRNVLVAGDYNARFGQGLALWNGMSISGAPVPSAMMKRSSGISPSSSFVGGYALRGVAGYVSVNRMIISPFLAVDSSADDINIMPGVNMSFFTRRCRFSMTHYSDMAFSAEGKAVEDMKTSADMSGCFNGTDVFSEISYDWISGTTAIIAGTVFPIGDDFRYGMVARFYPSDYSSSRSVAMRSLTKCSNEYALAVSTEFASGKWIDLKGRNGFGSSVRRNNGSMTLDLARFPVSNGDEDNGSSQVRFKTDWTCMLSDSWKMSLLISERIRSWGMPFRSEARIVMAYDIGCFNITLRTDLVVCNEYGFLSYVESGYVGGKSAFFARTGLFLADEWEDRIYAYERDAPGSFNIPAYYGRGFWSSVMWRWSFARWGRLYLRAAVTSYPLMEEKKPGKAELKFQLEIKL